MDTICSLLRVVEYTCISVWLSNDHSSKSLNKVYFSPVYTFIFLFLPQYLALFDLVHLSQFSLTRRKQIFSLSQPSEIYFNICPYFSRCKFPILVHVHNSVWPYTTYFCQIQKITTSLTLKHSHEWPRHNFSLQYQYITKQTTDQNSEKTIN